MKNHEKDLLVDAIHEAVMKTRDVIILKRVIIVLAIGLGLSLVSIASLLIWG